LLPLELLGAPEGSCFVRACLDVEQLTVHLAITAPTAACPVCGSDARRVRSRYTRRLNDLPCLGRRVRLRVAIRRFVCPTSGCPRRIFAERLPGFAAPRARTTDRLRQTQTDIGSSLGGGKRAVTPYPRGAAIPAGWPRVAHAWPNRPGRDHARGHQSCSPLLAPPSPLVGVGLPLRSPDSGSSRNRPRVSRPDCRSGRRRPSALVGCKRVGEPRSFSSTTRTTRRLRRSAPQPVLATPETRAEFL
jgi:hypothetical protein